MLNIGDATFKFLANTTELDLAFTRIVEQANVSALETGAAFDGISAAVASSSASVDGWNETIMEATGKTAELSVGTTVAAESMRGMSEEARVAEEMIGVRLPRGVNRFMAEIPGLQGAISAAFSIGIVYFFAEALVNVSEKLSKFVADTFIYTQAMKDRDAAIATANKLLLEHAAAIDKANHAIDEYGMTASQKTQVAIEANNIAWAGNTANIRLNEEQTAKLKGEQQSWAGKIDDMTKGVLNSILGLSAWSLMLDENAYHIKNNQDKIDALGGAHTELLKQQQQSAVEMKVLTLQLRDEDDAAHKATIAKQTAFGQASIESAKTIGSALLAMQKAQAEASVAFDDLSGVKRLMIAKTFAEADYQLDLETRKKKLASAQQSENQLFQIEKANLENLASVQKTMGVAGIAGAAATQVRIEELAKSHNLQMKTEATKADADIEALQTRHAAKTVQDYADLMAKVHAIIKQGVETVAMDATWSPLEKAAIKAEKDIENAFALLGVQSTAQLQAALLNASKAYDTLKKSGVASAHDLMVAELQVLKVQLEVNKAMGDVSAVKKTDKAISDLTTKLQKMEGEENKAIKLKPNWDKFFDDLTRGAMSTGKAMQTLGQLTVDAIGASVEAAVSGSDSFGQAMEKMLKSALASLAGHAVVKVMEELAAAASDLATPFFEWHAATHFHAAAMWGAIGAGAAVAGSAIPGGNKSSGAGAGSAMPAMTTGNSATQPGTNPTQGVNVPHLAGGGLITGPTLAMLGENSGREAVLPLNDGNAMNMIAEAISKHLGAAGGGGTNFYIKGMVSGDTVGKLAKKISRQVQTGRTRLTASTTHKITRRA